MPAVELQLAKANASQQNSPEMKNPSIQLPQKIAPLSVTFKKGKKHTLKSKDEKHKQY